MIIVYYFFSVLMRSPPELIADIVLVDDYSDEGKFVICPSSFLLCNDFKALIRAIHLDGPIFPLMWNFGKMCANFILRIHMEAMISEWRKLYFIDGTHYCPVLPFSIYGKHEKTCGSYVSKGFKKGPLSSNGLAVFRNLIAATVVRNCE